MKNTLLLFCITICSLLSAQSIEKQVVTTAGNTISANGITLDFTIGELAVTEITNGTTTLSQGFQQGEIKLSLKVNPNIFLQGAGINPNAGQETLMRDDLRVASVLPTTSPYDSATTAESSVFNIIGPNAIVDWVLVELRDATDRAVVLASQSALLQRDGDIVTTDGTSELNFELANGSYYISVNHRNHLAILSQNTIALNGTTTTIDLSTDSANVFGGVNAVTQLANGKYAMLAGDVDSNGQIQNSDASILTSDLGGAGYSNSDADMNNQTQNSDINSIVIPAIGKAVQF